MTRLGGRGLALILALLCVGLGLAAPAFAAAPTITSFTPTSGPVATSVVLTGTGFTSASTVTFNGVRATSVTFSSATRISARVPVGASTGKVTVSTSGGTVTSTGSFTVTTGITLATTYGPPTTPTALSASAFGAHEAADVYFDTADLALVTTTAAGAISTTVTVPASASPGTHTITVVGRHSGDAAQASFLVRTNWSQTSDNSGRTGANKLENTLSAGNVSQLDEAWRTPSTGSFALTGGPVVYNGTVYATFRDFTARAFSLASGAQLWSHQTSDNAAFAPSVGLGRVFIADGDSVVALSAATGAVVWSRDLGGEVLGDPIVYGSGVYVTAGDAVWDLDGLGGSTTWDTPLTQNSSPYNPTVSAGRVFVTDSSHFVTALSASNGGVLWSDPMGEFLSTPAVSGGFVYVGLSNGQVMSLRTDNGSTEWVYTDPAGVQVNAPAIAGGNLYMTDISGSIFSLNASTGTARWSVSLPYGTHAYARPSFANSVVYADNDTGTFAYSIYGSLLWSVRETAYYYSPAVVDGSLVAGTTFANLVRFTINGAAAPAAAVRPDPKRLHPTIG